MPDDRLGRGLNMRTTRRIAAGLGARTVRHNQEELMAAAWDQLGAVREVADELNRGRLSAEVGRTWQARVAQVERGDRVNLAAPLLSFVRSTASRPGEAVADSLAPVATLDRVWARRTPRARGASASSAFLRRDPGRRDRGPAAARLPTSPSRRPRGCTRSRSSSRWPTRAVTVLSSAQTVTHVTKPGLATRIGGARLDGLRARQRQGDRQGRASSSRVATAAVRASADDVARAVAITDPLLPMRASLVARIPALERLLPSGELPAQLRSRPSSRTPCTGISPSSIRT